jgi:pyruvate dehydrogenase E2 component (dihydrolipoamide acetyltransferase)
MGELVEIKVPDIGDFTDVPIIDVMVKAGDRIGVEDALVTLESDKAIMDVPAPQAGVIKEVKVKVGDKVSEGTLIVVIEAEGEQPASDGAQRTAVRQRPHEVASPGPDSLSAAPASPPPSAAPDSKPPPSETPDSSPSSVEVELTPQSAAPDSAPSQVSADAASGPTPGLAPGRKPHASPLARRFARELGVDLDKVKGGATSGRILKADIEGYVRTTLAAQKEAAPQGSAAGRQLDLAPWPKVDFAKFGPIEVKPLARIRKISGTNLARNWVMIPHVTQFDDADVTELEAFRQQVNETQAKDATRVTILALVVKGCIAALKEYPEFNASLDGSNLVLKKYFHIGIAVDTADGLVVPVVHDADRKGVLEIAREIAELSAAAREGKLKLTAMQGGCFTISSLGGIGGTAFTPIINAPEVAVLGLSRTAHKPVYRDGAFVPRLILPLSLSYDHRVIDGAVAARFITYLGTILADIRRALL